MRFLMKTNGEVSAIYRTKEAAFAFFYFIFDVISNTTFHQRF